MNEEVTQTEQEVAMMTVIADIVEGGRGLIRDWPLRANAEQALREGGPAGWRATTRTASTDRAPGRPGSRPCSKPTARRPWSRSISDSWRSTVRVSDSNRTEPRWS